MFVPKRSGRQRLLQGTQGVGSGARVAKYPKANGRSSSDYMRRQNATLGAAYFGRSSLTSERSSFSSARVASILVRLKPLRGTPCTISHLPLETVRIGKLVMSPCSHP